MHERDNYPTAEGVLALLGLLSGCFAPEERGRVDTLEHSLQAATRAERAGAPEPMVAATLCHDMGKVFSLREHDRVVAALLSGYVPPDVVHVVRHHVHFTANAWDAPEARARQRYRSTPWYADAARFADEWDVPSFDPAYPAEPLAHFEPLLRDVFALPRWPSVRRLPPRLERWRGTIDRCRRLAGRG